MAGRRWALVVGGGTGARMSAELGTDLPKQFLRIGGRPVLVHTLQRFLGHDAALRVVLVLPEAYVARADELVLSQLNLSEAARVRVVAGGTTRTESVRRGLAEIAALAEPQAGDLVAVQDAVRPFVTEAMIAASYTSAAERGSGVCCVASKASLRRLTEGGATEAVDRTRYLAVQTPQTFTLSLLLDCYARAEGDFTDDASLVEAQGHPIYTVPGRYDNLKLTTAEDLLLAELLLKGITPADYL